MAGSPASPREGAHAKQHALDTPAPEHVPLHYPDLKSFELTAALLRPRSDRIHRRATRLPVGGHVHISAFSACVCSRIRALCNPLDTQSITGYDTESRLHEGGVSACALARGRGDCGMSPILTDLGRFVVGTLQVSWLCWPSTWIAQMPC